MANSTVKGDICVWRDEIEERDPYFMYKALDKVYEKEVCASNSINVKDTNCNDLIGAPSVMILHPLLSMI